MTEQELAKEFLRQKVEGISIAYVFKKHLVRYIFTIALVLLFLVGGSLLSEKNSILFLGVLAGMLLGAILRDYGALRKQKALWPFSRKIADWNKVEAIARGEDCQQENA